MKDAHQTRRQFVAATTLGAATLAAGCSQGTEEGGDTEGTNKPAAKSFKISLAQWSLHRGFWGDGWGAMWQRAGSLQGARSILRYDLASVLQGDLDPLDFASIARNTYGVDAIEYVNTFYFDKATNQAYLNDLKSRADGEGVRSVLIMCDMEGALGDPDSAARQLAIESHHKWVDAASYLGCHSIRVNAQSSGTREEQHDLAVEGLSRLAEYAKEQSINVLVENHGGFSSDGQWLASVMKTANMDNLGTLPDFGNFRVDENTLYDYYQGVEELMPYAKAVSAKTFDFDEDGNETTLDYPRLMKTVLDHGYDSYVGIEYEGDRLSEPDGIRATKALLEDIRASL